MDKSTLQTEEEIQTLFDFVLSNEKVASIELQPPTGIPKEIIVLTTPLRVLLKGNFYWIDPLVIKIVINGNASSVSIFKSHPKQRVSRMGWPVPHVRQDGSVCWGNISNDVGNSLRHQEWAMVIELAISLLESCAPREMYESVLKEVTTKIEIARKGEE